MKSEKKYWQQNFNDEKVVASAEDLQINIARTKKGVRISDSDWIKTLEYIKELIEFSSDHYILELCCGNGVIIGELSKKCKVAVGVDYSEILLNQLKSQFNNESLKCYHADVLEFSYKGRSFDSVIIYFSIQHFSPSETIKLVEKALSVLKPGGSLLIGDVPDEDKKWQYINKPKYIKDFYSRTLNGNPKIGFWFKKDFFLNMKYYFEGIDIKAISQPLYQINSDHCFDILIKKSYD